MFKLNIIYIVYLFLYSISVSSNGRTLVLQKTSSSYIYELIILTLIIFRFGLSFMGSKWSEETLIGFAYAFEQRTNIREKVQPYFVPNTQLADVIGK
jgi:hypothetical protein